MVPLYAFSSWAHRIAGLKSETIELDSLGKKSEGLIEQNVHTFQHGLTWTSLMGQTDSNVDNGLVLACNGIAFRHQRA